jgi:4-aminobutyrate aminotransferase-like enzyme
MPPGSGLDTVLLVNSGSEANDLAWRLAVAATGREGALVTGHAYHGVTTATAALSPEEWPPRYEAPATERFAPSELPQALERLSARGAELAAAYVDGGFTSDGILTPPQEQLREIVRQTHAAGGLYVADEVQVGHGRTGEHLWSFAADGLEADFVTLGKPMGNGYPVAAVITRAEISDRFAEETQYFSTFGGNPVACAAALAVLDVIADERLVENAARVGGRLLRSLDELRAGHPEIVEVRGRGLLAGVELPDAALAKAVVDRMREDAVLIGRTGRGGNVLKIRPPLVFAAEHADRVVEALAKGLGP